MKALIIGIGTFYGDDQLGLSVVNVLAKDLELTNNPNLVFIECRDLGANLLNLMQEADQAYLIDSVKAGTPVGTLFEFENEEINEISSVLSRHSIGLAETLELGRVLGLLPRKILFFGMEIGDFSDSWHYSKSIISHLPNFLASIKNKILYL